MSRPLRIKYPDPWYHVMNRKRRGADHKAFLSEEEHRELAIGAMEKRLDIAKKALKKKPANEADNN